MADRKAFPLRIDSELYEALRVWAEQEMRSVNGQIEYLLRQAVQARRKSQAKPGGPARAARPPSNGTRDAGDG